jgi:hypothetical protein
MIGREYHNKKSTSVSKLVYLFIIAYLTTILMDRLYNVEWMDDEL